MAARRSSGTSLSQLQSARPGNLGTLGGNGKTNNGVDPATNTDSVLGENDSENDGPTVTYEEIMGLVGPGGESQEGVGGGGASALGSRLVAFRKWLSDEAMVKVHPSVCIVNGEATDGTKNAPVLTFGPPPSSLTPSSQPASGAPVAGSGRCGMIDLESDRALYDRTMGCQVRVARELKKGEVMMEMPRAAMITPDLIAASDAGRAVLACCEPVAATGPSCSQLTSGFWDVFGSTVNVEKKFADKVALNNGTQLLVKILHERKKAEAVISKAERAHDEAEAKLGGLSSRTKSRKIAQGPPNGPDFKLARRGTISTRAPILAFILHQRFANELSPSVASPSDPRLETVGDVLASGDIENVESRQNGNKISSISNDASTSVPRSRPPSGSPSTFAPYARTLPSAISLPICWKRNELALLARCIPGMPPLQEVAARTLQLSSDLIALVDAGILHRFPDIFPRGLITWDRWVWAASVLTSRVFPVSCYLNKGEQSASEHRVGKGEQFLSPPEVWDQLGVLIPLLDMLNHESEAAQITWEPPLPQTTKEENIGSADDGDVDADSGDTENQQSCARVIVHKRVKKGAQVYNCYGTKSNQRLMLQYGFAQMNNPADEVRIGWGLMDAVGNVPPPTDYEGMLKDEDEVLEEKDQAKSDQGGNAQIDSNVNKHENKWDTEHLVFESVDALSINSWWTEDRLAILEKETLVNEAFMSNLRKGKKMTALAYRDGTFHPIFLTAAVVATMPPRDVQKYSALAKSAATGAGTKQIMLSKRHQWILRNYISFVFTRKLEKLLQSLNNGLKDDFNNVQLWTKSSAGGLQYTGNEGLDGIPAEDSVAIGWQSFFDSYAYSATIEVEKRYYAMGPDSCVLTLYDGHLRSLQASIDAVSSPEKFEESALRQLEDLGFVISKDDSEIEEDVTSRNIDETAIDESKVSTENTKESTSQSVANGTKEDNKSEPQTSNGNRSEQTSKKGDATDVKATAGTDTHRKRNQEQSTSGGSGKGGGSERNRNRRNRKRGDRPPAIKLHIGNLSYNTVPSELFDFFAAIYGRENVLECHIPTERETGKSRGFGFVTMPEASATQALQSDRKHEIDGRVLKIAESNTAGSGKTGKGAHSGASTASDRCVTCGYRPRYCTCTVPNIPGLGPGPLGGRIPPLPIDDIRGPPPMAMMEPCDYVGPYGRPYPDFDNRPVGSDRRRSRSWNDRGRPSYSQSPSPVRGVSRGSRADSGHSHYRDSRRYDRSYRDYRGSGRSYSRSRSRSYSRGRDRDRRVRDHGRGRERSRERSRSGRRSSRARGSSSGWGGRSSRGSRFSRSRSRSRTRSRSRSRSYSKGPQSHRGGDRERTVSGGSGVGDMASSRGRSRSRSPSVGPPQPRGGGVPSSSDRKRDGQSRKRSRSRSRGRASRRKRSSKKEASKRHTRSKSLSSSRSRSWSKD